MKSRVAVVKRSAELVKESDDVGNGKDWLHRSLAEMVNDVNRTGKSDDSLVQEQKSHPVQNRRSHAFRLAGDVDKTLKYGPGFRNRSRPVGEGARRCKTEAMRSE